MPTVHVSLAHRSYDIVIDHGLLAETSTRCRRWCGLDTPGSALIVTDANLAGAKLQNAYLYDTNLFGADLSGANLTGADLT